MKYYNLVLPAFEASPKDVRIWDAVAVRETKTTVSRNVFLLNELPVGGGVFPATGHVRAPDAYGPTGTEYTGTETLPAEGQVQLGVGYGENGTEFTGTLAGGTGKHRVRSVM